MSDCASKVTRLNTYVQLEEFFLHALSSSDFYGYDLILKLIFHDVIIPAKNGVISFRLTWLGQIILL